MSTDAPISPLVADLIEAQLAMTHDVTNRVIDGLTADRDDARATLAAIRDGVSALLDGPYQPTTDAIVRALWPSSAVVDQYREADAR